MIDPRALIKARGCGAIRYAIASEPTGDLERVLSQFGLRADPSLLVEHDPDNAFAILVALLWKDMAYEDECMSQEEAEAFAQQLFATHATPSSKYYSNGNVAKGESWNPLTDSTFDSGLVITGNDKTYFCIWFQDED